MTLLFYVMCRLKDVDDVVMKAVSGADTVPLDVSLHGMIFHTRSHAVSSVSEQKTS